MNINEENTEQEGAGCYLSTAFIGFWVVLVVKWLWPDVIPFELFEFWTFHGSLQEVLTTSWPILAWGVSLVIATLLINKENKDFGQSSQEFIIGGTLISIWTGVVEELCFRWIIFYNEIIAFKVANFLWLGFPSYLYFHIVSPTANFFTLGYLQPFLMGNLGWAVGAAIIGSNGKFRDGHSYQGLPGYINSWFLGMGFFYIMFKHGLFAAMLIHFLYNFLLFFVQYVYLVVGRQWKRV